MSRPFFSVKYVSTRSALPEKLERGRAYFIGDEQIILVDYGNGPITYGSRPGPQGIPGEPLPQLQGQIDLLADASIETTSQLFDTNQKMRARSKELTERIASLTEAMQNADNDIHSELDLHTGYINELREIISTMQGEISDLQSVISIVTKLIALLYPNADNDMWPEGAEINMKPLAQNEILKCGSGDYKVRESYTDTDGAVVVVLDLINETDQARILTLHDGDKILTSSNEIWTVSGYDIVNEQGVITLSYAGTQNVINALKAGDTVEYDGMKFQIESISTGENGQAEISLTLVDGE